MASSSPGEIAAETPVALLRMVMGTGPGAAVTFSVTGTDMGDCRIPGALTEIDPL